MVMMEKAKHNEHTMIETHVSSSSPLIIYLSSSTSSRSFLGWSSMDPDDSSHK
jgi:hypothetical protein